MLKLRIEIKINSLFDNFWFIYACFTLKKFNFIQIMDKNQNN